MAFVGRVVLEMIAEPGLFDRGLWHVVEPLVYKSNRHPNIVIAVPSGFETDLASVPRWLPLTWMLTGGSNVRASVVHDRIYNFPVYVNGELKMLPREVCDDIFDEIGEEDQVPGWRRSLMWAGIRAFGGASYSGHSMGSQHE